MSLTLYRATGSLFERVHPVTKIIALVLAFVPPFVADSTMTLLPYFLLLLFTAIFSGAGPNLRRMRMIMMILFLMSIILWSIFRPGHTPYLSLGPITIMKESFFFGVMIGFRLNCFVLAALIFLTSTPTEDFTYGLSRLGLPFVAGFALSLAFRLTPMFMEIGQTIVVAQRARGLNLDAGGPIRRIRLYAPIIVPVLLGGLRRADQLSVALESKGFGSGIKRTSLQAFGFGWRDAILLLILAATSGAMVAFQNSAWKQLDLEQVILPYLI